MKATTNKTSAMTRRGARLAASGSLRSLETIMNILLSPDGCPWDRKQTHSTLVKYLREESGEVAAAVRKKDWKNLEEELGDVLLQVVFHAALAHRDGRFCLADVIRGVNAKMVRRHPHVFGGGDALKTPTQVLRKWAEIKKAEKGRK